MAHIIFVAKRRANASYQLAGPTEMGRSVECGIFVPDVFTSRRHCIFTPTEDGWVIEDLESRNGIYFRGRRIRRRLLQHGDQLEIGSFTIVFDETDLPLEYSTPIPFGEGTTVVPLMDTLFSGELRPSEYLKASRRKPSWIRAREAAEEVVRQQREAAEAAARELAERLNFSDGAELDLEWQIAQFAEEMQPMYILVPREMAMQLVGPEAPIYGQPGMDVAEEGNLEGFERLAAPRASAVAETMPAGVTSIGTNAPGATAPGRAVGPRPGNLWSQASGTAETVIAPAAEQAAAEPAPAKPKVTVELYRPSIWERIGDWWRAARSVDLSLSAMIEAMRAHLVRTISVAVVLLALGIWGTMYYSKPHYRSPDYSKLSPEQRKAIADAANAN